MLKPLDHSLLLPKLMSIEGVKKMSLISLYVTDTFSIKLHHLLWDVNCNKISSEGTLWANLEFRCMPIDVYLTTTLRQLTICWIDKQAKIWCWLLFEIQSLIVIVINLLWDFPKIIIIIIMMMLMMLLMYNNMKSDNNSCLIFIHLLVVVYVVFQSSMSAMNILKLNYYRKKACHQDVKTLLQTIFTTSDIFFSLSPIHILKINLSVV